MGLRPTRLATGPLSHSSTAPEWVRVDSNHTSRGQRVYSPPEPSRGPQSQPAMLGAGLEPARPFGHWHLKPARLPFHHPSVRRRSAQGVATAHCGARLRRSIRSILLRDFKEPKRRNPLLVGARRGFRFRIVLLRPRRTPSRTRGSKTTRIGRKCCAGSVAWLSWPVKRAA